MGVPRNTPCPCGSGKKYKNCCFQKNYIEVTATKKDVVLSISDDVSVKKKITDINSIPVHNKNGLRPNISKNQMIDLCLDEIFNILKKLRFIMLKQKFQNIEYCFFST